MEITNAQYISDLIGEVNVTIRATINGQETFVPIDPANTDYAEIMRQVEAGELTIQEAE
jgi:hypothetical protein